jgi:hypothetical protein
MFESIVHTTLQFQMLFAKSVDGKIYKIFGWIEINFNRKFSREIRLFQMQKLSFSMRKSYKFIKHLKILLSVSIVCDG